MENYLKKYLKHIQMETNYIVSDINCEICDSKENTVIRENISLGKGLIGKLPVVACNNCGFLYQNPRFEEKFYEDFYSKNYRNVIFGKNNPDEKFINDQTILPLLLYPKFDRACFLCETIKEKKPKKQTNNQKRFLTFERNYFF